MTTAQVYQGCWLKRTIPCVHKQIDLTVNFVIEVFGILDFPLRVGQYQGRAQEWLIEYL